MKTKVLNKIFRAKNVGLRVWPRFNLEHFKNLKHLEYLITAVS